MHVANRKRSADLHHQLAHSKILHLQIPHLRSEYRVHLFYKTKMSNEFELALEAAYSLWLDGKLDECCEATQKILKMDDLSVFYRIRAWILMATSCADDNDAEGYLRSAEQHWKYAKDHQIPNEDPAVDKALDVLRKYLDAARRYVDDEGSDSDVSMVSEEEEDAAIDEGVELSR